MNSETIWCLIVDDCPIGTATWRDGVASATVTYDDEIKYFNNESFYDMLAEIAAHVRSVEQYYNDAAEAELCKVEYDNEVIAPMEHAERKAEKGKMFIGGWELK
jgi:hypothetical protein